MITKLKGVKFVLDNKLPGLLDHDLQVLVYQFIQPSGKKLNRLRTRWMTAEMKIIILRNNYLNHKVNLALKVL